MQSTATKNAVLRIVSVLTVAVFTAVTVALPTGSWVHAQSPQIATPKVHQPDESAGIDGIVLTLFSVFDEVDIVALGEAHQRKLDSDLRIALVRHPDFPKKVRFIVVEFGSTTEQTTLDRYIRGENVPRPLLERVWKTTTQAANHIWDDPMYLGFFTAVRDVNSKLPADAQVRVLGGDPGPGDNRSRETAAVSVLKEQVLQKHGKALVVYGAAHFYRSFPEEMLSSMGDDIGLLRRLEKDYPGRTLAVIPLGGPLHIPPGAVAGPDPDYRKFDRALKTQARPVLVSLQRLPFRDLRAEEFMGRTIFNCRGPGGCRSVFHGSPLSLGQIADACVYVGADMDTKAKPSR